MEKFFYKAKNDKNEIVTGEIETVNPSSAAKILTSKKLFPIEIRKTQETAAFLESLPFLSFLKSVSRKKKALAVGQLASLVGAGLPVAQALGIMEQESSNKILKSTFGDILTRVEGGSSLADAFSRHPNVFSELDTSIIASGEKSGNLEKVLKRMANQLEQEAKFISRIRGAMIYPAVILTVAAGVVILMLVYVLPKLKNLYDEFKGELPLITRIMMGVSDFLKHFWWLFLLFLAASFVAFRYFIRTPSGRKSWDSFKLKIPLFKNLITKIYLARFTRTLGTLVGSGVSILDSLKITSKSMGNVSYEEEVLKMADEVRAGSSLSSSLSDSVLFPPIVSQMMKIGEQTGEMDSMLDSMANYYEDEVDNIVKALATLMEPVIIVFMGIIVAAIMLAIMMPIYTISQVIFKR